MNKVDLKKLALSCLALGMVFAAPSLRADDETENEESVLVAQSDDEEEDDVLFAQDDEEEDDALIFAQDDAEDEEGDYLMAAGCGGSKGGCSSSTPTGKPAGNGAQPAAPTGTTGPAAPKGGSCSNIAARPFIEDFVDEARRVNLI